MLQSDSVKSSKIKQTAITVLLSEFPSVAPFNDKAANCSYGVWRHHTFPCHYSRKESFYALGPMYTHDTRGTTTIGFVDGHAEAVPTYVEAYNWNSDKAWELAKWLKFHPTCSVNRGNNY